MGKETKLNESVESGDEHGTGTHDAKDCHPDKEQRATRRTTAILLCIIAIIFIWYIFADRLTPFTSSSRVKAYVVAMIPEVSGYVAEIPIKKNQFVKVGEPLLQIEKKRFELAVAKARSALEIAGQDIGVDSAAVSSAMANVASAQAKLESARILGKRIFILESSNMIAKVKADEARKAVKTAKAELAAAQAELERAHQKRGEGDKEDNPRMRAAVAALDEALLNLERTTILSPGDGFVGGLKIDEGSYINAGEPAMTFISVDDIWVEAYMTENQLSRVDFGSKVELAFDAFPGRIYHGKVKSTGAGVSTGKKADFGDLSTAQKNRGWMRDPQRFPVIIEVTDYTHDMTKATGLRLNSLADVIIYTGDHFFWNGLGKMWIRLMSWLSFAY